MLCFCFVFHRLVYPVLPVSLHFPFLIAPSVFSNVYLFMMIEFQLCKLIFKMRSVWICQKLRIPLVEHELLTIQEQCLLMLIIFDLCKLVFNTTSISDDVLAFLSLTLRVQLIQQEQLTLPEHPYCIHHRL